MKRLRNQLGKKQRMREVKRARAEAAAEKEAARLRAGGQPT